MADNIMPTSLGELFSFKGRLSRIPYVARIVVANILLAGASLAVMSGLVKKLEDAQTENTALILILGSAAMITLIIVVLAQVAKRVRDIGWPVWTVPAFLMGSLGLGIIGTDSNIPALAILSNVASIIAGLAIVFMPSKKVEFPDTIYSRTPDNVKVIDDMLAGIPDTGGNTFLTFIFADDTKAEFDPDMMHQMKVGWAHVRETMEKGADTSVTILRRDASDTIRNGENITDNRMWVVNNQRAWELTVDEIETAMA